MGMAQSTKLTAHLLVHVFAAGLELGVTVGSFQRSLAEQERHELQGRSSVKAEGVEEAAVVLLDDLLLTSRLRCRCRCRLERGMVQDIVCSTEALVGRLITDEQLAEVLQRVAAKPPWKAS